VSRACSLYARQRGITQRFLDSRVWRDKQHAHHHFRRAHLASGAVTIYVTATGWCRTAAGMALPKITQGGGQGGLFGLQLENSPKFTLVQGRRNFHQTWRRHAA
jgi:hypothetical protein